MVHPMRIELALESLRDYLLNHYTTRGAHTFVLILRQILGYYLFIYTSKILTLFTQEIYINQNSHDRDKIFFSLFYLFISELLFSRIKVLFEDLLVRFKDENRFTVFIGDLFVLVKICLEPFTLFI